MYEYDDKFKASRSFSDSQFSPEDAPSNFIGTYIGAKILRDREAADPATAFHPTVSEWRSAVFKEAWDTIQSLEPLSSGDTKKLFAPLFKQWKNPDTRDSLRNYRVEPRIPDDPSTGKPIGVAPAWLVTPQFNFYLEAKPVFIKK